MELRGPETTSGAAIETGALCGGSKSKCACFYSLVYSQTIKYVTAQPQSVLIL